MKNKHLHKELRKTCPNHCMLPNSRFVFGTVLEWHECPNCGLIEKDKPRLVKWG